MTEKEATIKLIQAEIDKLPFVTKTRVEEHIKKLNFMVKLYPAMMYAIAMVGAMNQGDDDDNETTTQG